MWCGGLGLRAAPPARELEKFFTLGTEIPAYAGMTSLRAGVRPACAKASAKASGQVLLLRTVVRSQGTFITPFSPPYLKGEIQEEIATSRFIGTRNDKGGEASFITPLTPLILRGGKCSFIPTGGRNAEV